ncbi:hypothetical protein F5144DRAFT_548815 [Chaetomium tenue]|uniref:Uncharacterized protein n=1 Tax=Chaetomium tenue TaxID=1854479 RepID=A0ACB7P0G5_9PEZI|nr:hypothetical protein F5144DRAFT_548815 [Chaetomium globosum]
MPSSRRSPRPGSSGGKKDSKVPPEILHQLGRAVLSYSLKKLSEQKASSKPRSQSSQRKSSRSKPREPSSASKRGSSRDLPRSDSGDMHALVSQLAVGVFAFGIRALIRRRKEAKKKAAAAAAAAQAGTRSVSGEPGGARDKKAGAGAVDPELSAALDSVTQELQGASDSIRRLAHSAPPPSHRDCMVRDALVADADRLSGSLANMQASIHNMKNLHPGLEQGMRSRQQSTRREGRMETRERDTPRERRVDGFRERGGVNEVDRRTEKGATRSRATPRTEEVRSRSRRVDLTREEERDEGHRHHRGYRTRVQPGERHPHRCRWDDEEVHRGRRPEPAHR